MAQALTYATNDAGEVLKVDGNTVMVIAADTATEDNDKTITNTSQYYWILASLNAAVTTSAAVGNRQIEAAAVNPSATTISGPFPAGAVQAASVTEDYMFAVTGDSLETVAASHYIPFGLVMIPPNYGIRIWDSAGIAPIKAQGTLSMATQPTGAVQSAGTLTLPTIPVGAVKSQGTLTVDTNPSDGDTMTVDAKVYTFVDDLNNDTDGEIHIGATLAATKLNIGYAFTASGGRRGVDWSNSMTAHTTVDIGAFTGDDAVLSAKTPGTAGDTIATTETFTAGTNVFDAATLGTTTAGVAGDTMTVDTKVYTFINGTDFSTDSTDGEIAIGANVAATQANIVAAWDLSGTAGTDYSTGMTAHPTTTIAAFAANAAVITAVTAGTAGDTIATTETFTPADGVFDAATLGTTVAGVAGDTVTVDTKVYTWVAVGDLSTADGEISIGANAAAAQANFVAAFDLSGTPGTDYSTGMTAHPTVDIAAFAADDAVLTAKTGGTAGNSIATTETFTPAGDVFDAATLGTTTAGVAGDNIVLYATFLELR